MIDEALVPQTVGVNQRVVEVPGEHGVDDVSVRIERKHVGHGHAVRAEDFAERFPARAGKTDGVVHAVAVDVRLHGLAHRVHQTGQRGGHFGDAGLLKGVHIVPVRLAEAVGTAGDGVGGAVDLARGSIALGEGESVRQLVGMLVQVEQVAFVGVLLQVVAVLHVEHVGNVAGEQAQVQVGGELVGVDVPDVHAEFLAKVLFHEVVLLKIGCSRALEAAVGEEFDLYRGVLRAGSRARDREDHDQGKNERCEFFHGESSFSSYCNCLGQ